MSVHVSNNMFYALYQYALSYEKHNRVETVILDNGGSWRNYLPWAGVRVATGQT